MNNKSEIGNNILGDNMESALVHNTAGSKLAGISASSAIAVPIIDGLLNAYSNTLNYLAIKREYEYLTTKVLEESRIFQIRLKNEYRIQTKKLKNDFKKYNLVVNEIRSQIKSLVKTRKKLINELSKIVLSITSDEKEAKIKMEIIAQLSELIMNFENSIKELNQDLLQLYKHGIPEIKEGKI